MAINEASIRLATLDLLANDDFALAKQTDGDQLWQIFCGALVFFMHAGFTMLEAGSIHQTSVANIMFKNIATVSIGVLAYWFVGFGLAYPDTNDDINGDATFLTKGGDFLGRAPDKAAWFFQMVFAATAATIVSGAVAGRIKLVAYFFIATVLTAVIFPTVSHWIWDIGGFLSAFTQSERLFGFEENQTVPCGTIDFAGSGVVHMTGGVAAFWGAMILGPRPGWTPTYDELPAHNFALSTLGTLILWFGWYGFNCGSTLVWDGFVAGHVAVNTTLAPGAAALVGMFISKVFFKQWDLGNALNSILAGLVGVTAGCATVRPGFAVLIGILSALIYLGASKLNRFVFKIDDPVDAVAVHGACGLFGLIAAGLFSDPDLVQAVYAKECDTGVADLLTFQFIAALSIFVWVSVWALGMFGFLKVTKNLKIEADEKYNIDEEEMGGGAYNQ